MALPTSTNTSQPTFTHTPEPTATPTIEPTSTPTVTPTPDLRVITLDSYEFLLTKEDCPPEAGYYIPYENWMSPHYNIEILSQMGHDEGSKSLEKTGRILGWVVIFRIGAANVKAPPEFYHNITQFKNHEGALHNINDSSTTHEILNYKLVEDNYPLGDYSRVYSRRELNKNGEVFIEYRIETAYRNYLSIVGGYGTSEFDIDYVLNIAEIALEKLKSAPLGEW